MVTNGKESRDTGSGEVDDLRPTEAYLAMSSTAFPYGDSKACSLLETFGIILSPMSGVEWAVDVKVSVSEAFPECVLRVDSRKSEIPML